MTTKTNLWIYRTNLGSSLNAPDIVGYDVHATDGDIGKIDDASTDTSRQYLVVDTGFWIFGKKRMIPAGVVTTSTTTTRRSRWPCRRTRSSPRRTIDRQESYDERDYDRFGDYYGDYGW